VPGDTEESSSGAEPDTFDTSVAHIARVYNFWLGGWDNYAADREAAEEVIAAYPTIRASVRAQRAFLGRAVQYLVTEAGIRQFLDIGTGLPSADNTHEVAQRAAPESRVVYVDNQDDPAAIVARLLAAVPRGSYLAIAHTASDITVAQTAEGVRRYNQQVTAPIRPRSYAEVCRFFAGLDLVEPGVVQLHRWRAGAGDLGTGRELANYGGVGRKL